MAATKNNLNRDFQDERMDKIAVNQSGKSSNSADSSSDQWSIPSDWKIVKISDAAKVFTGNTPPTNDSSNYGSDILFVSPADLGDEKYITKTNKKISAKGFSISRKFPRGSVLFTCIGSSIGKMGIASEELTSNQQINAIVVNTRNDNEFVYYQLENNAERIKLLAGEQAVPIINKSQFESVKLSIPPLPEQKAIARVLSTWDEAIHKTEQLIAQKELRKKWLMQQLLTGKMRLKGFGGEWKEMRIEDVTTNFSRRNKDLVDAKVFSVTNKSGFVLQSAHFEGKVAGEDLSNYKIIKKHEFAYNPARVNVGSLAYFEEEIGVISSLYVCFKTTKEVLDYFLLQFLQIDHTKHRIEALGEGGVRVYLWYDLFSKIKIKIPSNEEQTAIAQVLQAADKEINLLKAKAEKLRKQKKGLIQQLLTGKKRLKINK